MADEHRKSQKCGAQIEAHNKHVKSVSDTNMSFLWEFSKSNKTERDRLFGEFFLVV